MWVLPNHVWKDQLGRVALLSGIIFIMLGFGSDGAPSCPDKNSSPICSRFAKHSFLLKWLFIHNHEIGTTTIYKERPISSKYIGMLVVCGKLVTFKCICLLPMTSILKDSRFKLTLISRNVIC
ncbi:hypothetical protein GUJ93_ZPchr0005g16017 [Zizania palustris]|uniref:Uncharacterized protein n=1 Tax=Zizania palustris TaxID=103762 RepID=A0A8J5T546_ZIZPA|nr:hypothetical protein GUJ93_ZPchr0005g16017 [Zizania palustris]